MKNKRLLMFYLLSCIGVIAASFYPIYMGVCTVRTMLINGAITEAEYPKYIIPYTPIAISIILGVLLIPLFTKLFKKFDFITASVFSTAIFFVFERLMETKILVQTQELIPLEGWQMSLCYIPPDTYETRTWEAVDILLGGYSPAFKLHFYMISIVLIVSVLNCFYGFARVIRTHDKTRVKSLTVQTVASVMFLGMCIWACFTSFYRTGEITVPAVSAVLMSVFFILLGITVGIFTGSFTLGKSKKLSVILPAIVSSAVTLAMYIGEMILLSGNLYRFGTGVLFNGIPYLVLAPVDIAIIVFSGVLSAFICTLLNKRVDNKTPE